MKALIICAGENKNPALLKEYAAKTDLIICADGGYLYAFDSEIVPDIIIGDFDSLDIEIPGGIEKIQLPCEKDETDTQYAFSYAKNKGADEIIIYGGLGGRLDHTYANILLLEDTEIKSVLTDGKTLCYMTESLINLKGKKGDYISVFSFSDVSVGVTLKGLKYSLSEYTLKKSDILGVSNEFTDKEAEISVKDGKLLIICN